MNNLRSGAIAGAVSAFVFAMIHHLQFAHRLDTEGEIGDLISPLRSRGVVTLALDILMDGLDEEKVV